MLVIGLTGGMGMGKSSASAHFRKRGVPVFDADGYVHHLYEGAAVPAIEAAFPDAIEDGRVDRARLAKAVAGNPDIAGAVAGLRRGAAAVAARITRRWPPTLPGATLPVRRYRCDHFTTVDTATPKRPATARQVSPSSTAATTRSRRSFE